MKKKRVAIYGGTILEPAISGFVGRLTSALLENTDAVLVTGGYDFSEDFPEARSTDRSVADAAEHFATGRFPLETRLETWLPEHSKDRIAERVHRFEKGYVKRLEGGARKRRLAIVSGVDALITIKGAIHTALVLDVALTIGKPALPLPFTGGDSTGFWREYKTYYQTRFDVSNVAAAYWESLSLQHPGDDSTEHAVLVCGEVVQAVSRVLKTSCLVLMSFAQTVDEEYRKT